MSDKATTIRPTCPKCGKAMCIELPGYDALKAENERLRAELNRLKSLARSNPLAESFNQMFGGKL